MSKFKVKYEKAAGKSRKTIVTEWTGKFNVENSPKKEESKNFGRNFFVHFGKSAKNRILHALTIKVNSTNTRPNNCKFVLQNPT
jgi:hypothetical protein